MTKECLFLEGKYDIYLKRNVRHDEVTLTEQLLQAEKGLFLEKCVFNEHGQITHQALLYFLVTIGVLFKSSQDHYET